MLIAWQRNNIIPNFFSKYGGCLVSVLLVLSLIVCVWARVVIISSLIQAISFQLTHPHTQATVISVFPTTETRYDANGHSYTVTVNCADELLFVVNGQTREVKVDTLQICNVGVGEHLTIAYSGLHKG